MNFICSYQFLFADDVFIADSTAKRPTVALVLSGGGSRGAAHIGMLKCLEDNDIPIDYIVGTSIGAVVGGLYCSGYSASEIDSLFMEMNWDGIFSIRSHTNRENVFFEQKQVSDRNILTLRFNNFRFIPPKAVSETNILNDFFRSFIINSKYYFVNDFDKLKYPFRAVSTNLAKGESVALKSGNLSKAILASATIPINYAPVIIDNMILVDGGIMANVPVRFAKEFNPDIIIALDATSTIQQPSDLTTPLRIAEQAISISMNTFAKQDVQKADIIINPKFNDSIDYLDFSTIQQQINLGYEATELKLNEIREKIGVHKRLNKKDIDTNIRISKINIIHNKLYAPDKIFYDFPINAGDTLTRQKLLDCYKYLDNTGKFDDINIQMIPNNNMDYQMQMDLIELANQTLQLSTRLDNEVAVHVGVDFITKNIFSSNIQNQISLQASGKNKYIGIKTFNANIFNKNISAGVNMYYSWNDLKVYEAFKVSNTSYTKIIDTNFIRRQGIRTSVGMQIERKGLLNIEYRLENQTYSNTNDENKKYINTDYVSLIGFSVYYDSENLPYFPTKGGKINILLETNFFSNNAHSQFSKLQAYLRTNINFGNSNITPSLFFGAGDNTLPYPEFFSLGGQNNFFGMRENEEVGRQVFKISTEYRYLLPKSVSILSMRSYMAARYDLGSIWNKFETIKFKTLKHGVGAALLIDTPIGPASFSVGRSFNFFRTNTSKLNIRLGEVLFYFSLGVNF